MPPKLTTSEFIKKSKLIHGNDTYDYSKTVYETAKKDVIIICPKVSHGEFIIRPNNHTSGKQGCNKCGHKMEILTTEQFIEKAEKINDNKNKYDYSKVYYINMSTKVLINCRYHGEFEQTPSNHITHEEGCSICAKNYKSDTAEFIEKANIKHNNKYNYSNVHYINRETKIKIICPKHGEFEQTPGNHLYGYGCISCGKTQMINSQTKTNEEFITEANNIHHDKYNYSKVNYINARTYITIICPKHGEFYQVPDSHLRGCGCPKCYNRYSKSQIEYLSFMESYKKINIRHAENGGEYKIPNTKYFADGYDEINNTIYEYHGDFWHGNLKIYNKTIINPITKNTFGELYENTIKREEYIKSCGYKLKVIWDSEWKLFKKSIIKLQKMFINSKKLNNNSK